MPNEDRPSGPLDESPSGVGIVNILDLIRGRELAADVDLYELLAVAAAVQALREGASKSIVSRSSMLCAALIHYPDILDILETAGFDSQAFQHLLDPEGRISHAALSVVSGGSVALDGVPVEAEHLDPALKRYAKRFPGRTLDGRGLLFGILSDPRGGLLEGRLAQPRLDLSTAVERLAGLLAPSWRNLAPIGAVLSFPFSDHAVAVLRHAQGLASEYGAPVTTSMLLVALCSQGESVRERETSANVVYRRLASRDPRRYVAQRDSYLAWYRQPPHMGKAGSDQMTPHFHGFLVLARDIAERTGGEGKVHVRHLVAALVTFTTTGGPEPGAWALLRRLGSTPRDLATDLFEFVSNHSPLDDLAAWRTILLGDEPSAEPDHLPTTSIPPFDTDDLRDRDLLEIGPGVRAFATLFVSQDLVPPLSVGLFGDWGSGKSFFMRQLRQRVDRLAAAARARREAGRPTVLLGDVVQVEFNAWHYAEVNLWASLVTHIFDTLNRRFSPREELRGRWQALIRRLDEANRLQAGAEGMLRQAEEELKVTQQRLQDKQLGLADTMSAVLGSLGKEDRQDLERVAAALGLEDTRDLEEEIRRRRNDVRQLGERATLMGQATARALGSLGFVRPYVLLLFALAVTAGMALLASPYAGAAAESIRRLVTAATSTVAGFGLVVTWLGSALLKGARVTTTLERVERAFREKLRTSPEGAAVREAEHAVQLARDEVDERRRRLSEVRSQLEDLRPSRWLSDFLRERAASSDYHKYLGLTAIVRRDFEKLHELMSQEPLVVEVDAGATVRQVGAVEEIDLPGFVRLLNQALAGRDLPLDADKCSLHGGDDTWHLLDAENARRIDVSRRADGRRTCTFTYDGPRIDRIVLYIDDLDRCPPTRVVEVMEAVHLLLALPLFVVVVGVDVRWVSRSLELQYRDLWRRSPGESPATGAGPDALAATPRDYLEKIFQVPFWLRPLDRAMAAHMLAGLLEPSSTEPAAALQLDTPAPSADTTPGGALGPAVAAGAAEDHGMPPGARGTASATQVPGPPPGPPADRMHRSPPESPGRRAGEDRAPEDRRAEDDLAADIGAARLVLGSAEKSLILSLAPLVGRSPRAVKRFVNTYRLIRAAVPTPELQGFLGTPQAPGTCHVVLVLLAIMVGAPDQALALERDLATSPPDQGVRELVAAYADSSDRRLVPPTLTELADVPGNTWTVADLRRELARVNRWSFRSA